jgi:hypothetical protein
MGLSNSGRRLWAFSFLLVVLFSLKVRISESRPQELEESPNQPNNNNKSPSDYGESDYDDKDVQFDQSPPNLLILLADPKNGTTVPLANQPNTEVVLDSSYEKVHLFCSAYYPIRWVYHGDGVSFIQKKNVIIITLPLV